MLFVYWTEKGGQRGLDIGRDIIGILGYVNDLALLDHDFQRFRNRLQDAATTFSDIGMQLPVKKTKVMIYLF